MWALGLKSEVVVMVKGMKGGYIREGEQLKKTQKVTFAREFCKAWKALDTPFLHLEAFAQTLAGPFCSKEPG